MTGAVVIVIVIVIVVELTHGEWRWCGGRAKGLGLSGDGDAETAGGDLEAGSAAQSKRGGECDPACFGGYMWLRQAQKHTH